MSLTDEDKQWIREMLNGLEARMEGRLKTVEAKLLTAFHGWPSPLDARVRSHAAALRALDEGYDELRDRVKKLEEQK